MSAEDTSVSDVELDDEFDDFDPLAESDDGDAPAAPAGVTPAPDDDDASARGDDASARGDDASARGDDDAAFRLRGPEAQAAGTRRIIIVPPEERLSSNAMTLAEVTRAIAVRAQQISKDAYAFTDVGDHSDAISIARKELFDRRSPLQLERVMGRTPKGESVMEVWRVREMSYPALN